MAALETTKRKFHQLLDNLTSSTSTNSASSFVPGTKRRRIEPRSRQSTQEPKVPILRSGAPDPPPYYVPWSHDLFLARLKTFADVHRWSSKPSRVNEVAWAKRGWTCVGFNTVACKGGCEQRVVVSLRPELKDDNGKAIEGSEDFEVDVNDTLIKRFEDLIEHGHGEECLWRGKMCGDDIYRMPIARKSIWLSQLRDRYQSFVKIADTLPSIDQLVYNFDVEAIQRQLPSDTLQITEVSTSESGTNGTGHGEESSRTAASPNLTALAFALMGWTGIKEGNTSTAIATCHACFRRLGLWLYTSPSLSNDPAVANGESPVKLDLEHNHRDYCPWINAESQSMPGSLSTLAGWQFLQKAIRDNAEFAAPERPSSGQSASSGGSEGAAPQEGQQADTEDVLSVKTREQVEKEDNARFARLRELTKSMGLKSLRVKLGRG